MTLKEQLKNLMGYDVKIGFNSSFVYCGICDANIENILNELSQKEYNNLYKLTNIFSYELDNFDFLWKTRINKIMTRISILKEKQEIVATEKYIKFLKRLDKKTKSKFKKVIEEKEIKEIKSEKRKLRKEAKEKLSSVLNKIQVKYDKDMWLSKLEIQRDKRKQFLIKKTPKLIKRLNAFTPFLEREVIETYDSILDKNTKIIRCKGKEIGKYWTKQEYDKANKEVR